MSGSSYDLYSTGLFGPSSVGELLESDALTLNTDGSTTGTSPVYGISVDTWSQNCGNINFSDPDVFYLQVTLLQNGVIQLLYDGSCLFGDILSYPGDFNDDGAINSGDLLVFLGVFGTNCE